jgi:hypothetical protein
MFFRHAWRRANKYQFFIVFSLTRPGLEPVIYRTQGEHPMHYPTDAATIQTKFDASTLHENRQLAAETQMFDDGSGRAEV